MKNNNCCPDPKDFVSLNDRIEPDQAPQTFTWPDNQIFIITDIVIQNRAAGDTPVQETQHSRLVLSGDPDDFFLTVVGNNTLNLHFSIGIRVHDGFRIQNMVNSSAPFVEYLINGYLANKQ